MLESCKVLIVCAACYLSEYGTYRYCGSKTCGHLVSMHISYIQVQGQGVLLWTLDTGQGGIFSWNKAVDVG